MPCLIRGCLIFDSLFIISFASDVGCHLKMPKVPSANFVQTVKAKVSAFARAFQPAFAPVVA